MYFFYDEYKRQSHNSYENVAKTLYNTIVTIPFFAVLRLYSISIDVFLKMWKAHEILRFESNAVSISESSYIQSF